MNNIKFYIKLTSIIINTLKRFFKKFVYGTVPYCLCRLFHANSPNLKYYRYIKSHGYARHLFEFKEEYEQMRFPVQEDKEKGLYYVLNKQGHRLYFKKDMSVGKIEKCYRVLLMEQDLRSPHHYLDSMEEVKGKTFVDVGSAEGFTSLEVIEKASHVYLFEQDELWIEALNATFEPWKDKVSIIPKYVSDNNSEQETTLDAFFQDKDKKQLFIKMDIEGAERYALQGSKNLFKDCNLQFAICTYHGNDNIVVPNILREYGCQFTEQYGFFRHRLRSVVARGSSQKHNDVK